MNTDSRPKTVRVILFVLVSIAILVLLYALVNRVDMSGSPSVRVQFNSIGTIQVGSPVRKSGVKVGSVKMIQINEEDQRTVTVTLALYAGQIARQGDKITIASGGILGDQYIEILPGDPKARVLASGELVIGDRSLDLQGLASKGNAILTDLGTTSRFVSDFLSRNEKSLDRIIANVDKISTDMADLSGKVRVFMNRYEGSVGNSIQDLEASVKNFRSISENVKALTVALNSDGGIVDLLRNKETSQSIETSLKNIRDVTENLKKVSDELQKSLKQ